MRVRSVLAFKFVTDAIHQILEWARTTIQTIFTVPVINLAW